MGKTTQVMGYTVNFLSESGDRKELVSNLRLLQKQTRQILNDTTREMWNKMQNQEKFDNKAQNTLYHQYSEQHTEMGAAIVSATLRKAMQKFNSDWTDLAVGEMSLPTYKNNQPILIPAQSMTLKDGEYGYTVTAGVFSNGFKKAHPNLQQPVMQLDAKDKTQQVIFQKLLSKEYKLGQSMLTFDERQKKWNLKLTYSLEVKEHELDPNKILGIDLGCVNAIYASSKGVKGSLHIQGTEASAFELKQAKLHHREVNTAFSLEEKIRKEKQARQNQATHCGDSRIGRGTKKRIVPVSYTQNKLANYHNTLNDRYSRQVVDYAVKNGYGTIQLEDLKGFAPEETKNQMLRNWVRYDLQEKITYKAKAEGIKVIKVFPAFTSCRCSSCGHISRDNRKEQADFKCVKCGFTRNADWNASQNLSIKDIDKIIEAEAPEDILAVIKSLKAKKQRTEENKSKKKEQKAKREAERLAAKEGNSAENIIEETKTTKIVAKSQIEEVA